MKDINTIFGTEVTVEPEPGTARNIFTALPGVNGYLNSYMGTDKFSLIIRATIRAATYAALIAAVEDIDAVKDDAADTWQYGTMTWPAGIMEAPVILPGPNNRKFHLLANATWRCDIAARIIIL